MTAYSEISKVTSANSHLFTHLYQAYRDAEKFYWHPYLAHPSVTSKTKRSIDILLALLGLTLTVIIAIPLTLAMAIADPGPLLYSQIRCGLNGRPFRMWKFRSMVVGADKLQHLIKNEANGHIFKNENDPRITKIGAFLRCSSLDEFPQFWNVLIGEMSIVGTRPPTVAEVEKYDRYHWERLRVKPGITGEWQANGRSNVKNFEDIVRMDLQYQQNWSILYDFILIWKTILVVLKKTGAY